MSVAVVDRNPIWARFLEPSLRRAGLRLETLDSGAALFRKLQRAPLRTVVIDTTIDDYPPAVMLPMLRELHPETRVILTSTYMTHSLVEVLRQTPPFHVMVKPVNPETMRSVMAESLGLPILVA